MHKFKLGSRLRCTVTGFMGISIGRLEYLNGCIQYGLKPPMTVEKDKPPTYPESVWVDQGQLELVDEGITVAKAEGIPGGPETRGI